MKLRLVKDLQQKNSGLPEKRSADGARCRGRQIWKWAQRDGKDSSLVPAVWLRDGGAAGVGGGGIVREQIGRHWRVVRSLCQDARGSECLEDTAT